MAHLALNAKMHPRRALIENYRANLAELLICVYLAVLGLSLPHTLINILFLSGSSVLQLSVQIQFWSALILSLIIIGRRIGRAYFLMLNSPLTVTILLLPLFYILTAEDKSFAAIAAIRLLMLFSYSLAIILLVRAPTFFSMSHVLLVLMAFVCFIPFYNIRDVVVGPDWQNPENILDYKDSLGTMNALLAVISCWVVSEKRRISLSVCGIMVALSTIFFLSRSVVSIIMAPVGMLTFCFFVFARSPRPFVRLGSYLGFGLMMGASIWAVLNGSEIIQFFGRDPTLTGRTLIWQEGYSFITERPILGYGYAILENLDSPISVQLSGLVGYLPLRLPHLHNSWLNIALQFGLMGLLLHLLVSIVLFRRAFYVLRFDRKLGALLLAINCMILVYTFSESYFMQARNQFMFMAFVMLLMPVYELRKRDTITTR